MADGQLDVVVRFIGDASRLQTEAQKVEGVGSKLASTAKGIAVGVGVAFATQAVTDWVADAEAAEAASAKLSQTLRNAGDSSGAWAAKADELASSLQSQTGVDDEVIKGGQTILATFHEVAGAAGQAAGTFDRATKAAVDMSAAGFGSVESAATMLGKALQDPTKGITALGRAGVTFTKQQQDQIKAMVAAGDAAGAQALILKEVENQVGGVAAASATASAKMSASFGEAKEAIGAALLPVLQQLAPVLQSIAGFIQQNATWLVPLTAAIVAVVAAIKTWMVVQTAINFLMTANPIGLIIAGIAALIAIIVVLVKNWDTVAAAAQAAWDWILDAIQVVWNWIKRNWPLLLGILTGPIGAAVALIVKHWDTISGALGAAIDFMRGLWDGFVSFVTGIPGRILAALGAIGDKIVELFRSGLDKIQGLLDDVVGWFRELPGDIISALSGLASKLYNIGKQWMQALAEGVANAGKAVLDKAGDIANQALSLLNPFGSPQTRAFYQGQAVMADYAAGISSRIGVVTSAMANASARTMPALAGPAGGGRGGGAQFVLNMYPRQANPADVTYAFRRIELMAGI